MGGVRRCVFQAALAAMLAIAPAAAQAAIFDDGNDRKFVKDLREKDPARLTDEEKAILAAANNVGVIRVCGGERGGNAFFVRYGGRPAVLTSGHMLVDETGSLKCSSKQVSTAFYYPNAAYYDPEHKDDQYPLKRQPLVVPPLNLPALMSEDYSAASQNDWLVFLLTTDIIDDRMPNGRKRGDLIGSIECPPSGKLILIGVAPDIAKSDRALFQQGCDYLVKDGILRHNCDTVKGSSGSMLGVYEGGEIRIRGIHNVSVMGNEKLPKELTKYDVMWNGGALIETIVANADKPLPEFLAYDIQLKLARAGCYSGKLDNQWGPASRKALAAFAAEAETELPGTEPGPELLAVVEKVALEEMEVCRR